MTISKNSSFDSSFHLNHSLELSKYYFLKKKNYKIPKKGFVPITSNSQELLFSKRSQFAFVRVTTSGVVINRPLKENMWLIACHTSSKFYSLGNIKCKFYISTWFPVDNILLFNVFFFGRSFYMCLVLR